MHRPPRRFASDTVLREPYRGAAGWQEIGVERPPGFLVLRPVARPILAGPGPIWSRRTGPTPTQTASGACRTRLSHPELASRSPLSQRHETSAEDSSAPHGATGTLGTTSTAWQRSSVSTGSMMAARPVPNLAWRSNKARSSGRSPSPRCAARA